MRTVLSQIKIGGIESSTFLVFMIQFFQESTDKLGWVYLDSLAVDKVSVLFSTDQDSGCRRATIDGFDHECYVISR